MEHLALFTKVLTIESHVRARKYVMGVVTVKKEKRRSLGMRCRAEKLPSRQEALSSIPGTGEKELSKQKTPKH